jgi:large subunit ribosomal protein L29
MRLKASQLRDMTSEELGQKKASIKKELYELRYQSRLGRIEKPHRIGEARRELARIETILNEKRKPEEGSK